MRDEANESTANNGRDGALVRVVAVGNRLNIHAMRSEASIITELERIVGLAAPHLASDRPNLLTLAEVLGLPGALTGPRGMLARHPPTTALALGLLGASLVTRRVRPLSVGLAAAGLGSALLARRLSASQAAMSLLAVGSAPRVARCLARWPGVSPTRAQLLASTDALYRPFAETLSRLAAQYATHIVAGTIAPQVKRSTRPTDIARWGRIGADCVYMPDGPEVYNTALVFGPTGALLQRINKVHLTKSDREELDLTPGALEDVQVIATAAGRLGVAISLDAFTPAYVRRLEELEAEIVVQPDANDQPWAANSAVSGVWQPHDWLTSILGSIQPNYPHLRYNVCAMQTGNLFDIAFDGQSTITAKRYAAPGLPNLPHAIIGVDEYTDPYTQEPLVGKIIAAAPWVMEDPSAANPSLSLSERRRRLAQLGRELLPDGLYSNAYHESVIWADLPMRTARAY